MATQHDEDTMPEETQGYKLSQPKQSIAEYQQMGKFRPPLRFSHPPTHPPSGWHWQHEGLGRSYPSYHKSFTRRASH